MAEEDLKSGQKKTGAANQPKFRQIRPGKDHAVVINGQQVVLFGAPKKVSAKSEVVLPGYHLNVYDRVYLRAKGSRFASVNLHRAYTDSDSIIFNVPDFNNFLAEGDAVWVELVSSASPEANGYLFPHIKYSLKEEDKEAEAGEERVKEKGSAKGSSKEGGGSVRGMGFAGLAVSATGEAITGLVKPGSGTQQDGQTSAKDKLKQALKSGDKNALRSAIDEAKKNRDIESLREAYKEATGAYERFLFEDALDITDFKPKAVSEEESDSVPEYEPSEEAEETEEVPLVVSPPSDVDSDTVVAGVGTISSGGTAGAIGAGFAAGGQTGNLENISQSSAVQGAAVRSGKISGTQTVKVEQTARASRMPSSASQNVEVEVSEEGGGGSASVTTENRAEVSGEARAEQGVSSRRTVSGSTGGGEVQGKASVTSETEAQQETEGSIKTRLQGGGGSVAGSSTVEAATKARLTETIQGGGAEAEVEAAQETTISPGTTQARVPAAGGGISRQDGAPKVIQGEVGSNVPVQAPAGEVRVKGGAENQVSGTAQYGFSPIAQGSTVRPGVEIRSGMPGVRIEAAALKTPFQGAVGKPEAGTRPGEQVPAGAQAVSGGGVGIGITEDETIEAQAEREPKKTLDEERVLAQISPEAKQEAILFEARDKAQRKKIPGVAVLSPEEGAKNRARDAKFKPRQKNVVVPQVLVEPDEVEEEGAGEQRAQGQKLARNAKEKEVIAAAAQGRGLGPGGTLPVREPSPDTGGLKKEQALAPAGAGFSGGGGEEPPQEENAVGPGGEEPQNEQAAAEDQQQQNALSQALSDRIDKLAEDKKLDAEIKQVTTEASLALDGVLMEGVAWVWGAAIPSFGLAVLLGAIIGDFLWAFKNSIIEGVLKPLLRTEALKKKGEEIAKQIKISAKVKLNILAMNLIVAAAVMLVMLFLFLALWVGCNYPPGITKLTYKLSVVGALGGSGICESIDNMTSNFSFGGGDSGGAGASGSWGSPNGLLSTNQWTSQINQAAAQYSVDACILRVVVQKESTGQADIIGCDCAANGKPQLCPAGARGKYYPGYPFNWDQCSYGIGLTQWTIYPKSSSQNWNRWENQNTPSRNLFNDKYYYVSDFLNPQTSLDLTARAFKNYLAQSGGSVAGAFRSYMGNGAPQSWVDQRMALYNMCKSLGGQ